VAYLHATRTTAGMICDMQVFRGTSNAGPPLDVWSLGVILFASLCGRLPFEGSDLRGAGRPRDAAIRKRILHCQYKVCVCVCVCVCVFCV
jgi:hypothetical protein